MSMSWPDSDWFIIRLTACFRDERPDIRLPVAAVVLAAAADRAVSRPLKSEYTESPRAARLVRSMAAGSAFPNMGRSSDPLPVIAELNALAPAGVNS